MLDIFFVFSRFTLAGGGSVGPNVLTRGPDPVLDGLVYKNTRRASVKQCVNASICYKRCDLQGVFVVPF